MLKKTCLLLLLLLVGAVARTPEEFRDYARKSEFDVWYGLFTGGKKMGYFHLSGRLSEDGRFYESSEESYAFTSFAGERSEDSSRQTLRFSLVDGKLESAQALDTGGGERMELSARRRGDRLEIVSKTEARTTTRTVSLPKQDLEEEILFVEWLGRARSGDTFETHSLDLDGDELETPVLYTFEKRETDTLEGHERPVYTLSEVSQGLTMKGQVDERGVPLWQRAGEFIELRRMPAAEAKNMDEGPVEILSTTTVKSDVDLGADYLQKLVMTVSGLGGYKFPEAPYQKAHYFSDDQARLMIAPPNDPLPVAMGEGERNKYLRSTPSIGSDAASIRKVVDELGLKEMDPRRRVEILTHWVYKYLKKVSNKNAATAESVLANAAGDCTEHALLLTALARAAGIPAREVSGLSYMGDSMQAFAYHAWVEVYVNGGWMSVDPTFDQVPSDAGHILQSRDDALGELHTMGKLRIQVELAQSKGLNYRRPSGK